MSVTPASNLAIKDAAADQNGYLYLADAGKHQVQRYITPRGRLTHLTLVTQWGTEGSGDGQFSGPGGLTIDPSGEFLYVADTGNHRVQKFTTNGELVAVWGAEGSDRGQFNKPSGVAIDSSGEFLYVADTGNHRVQKFTTDGGFVAQWGSEGSNVGQFKNPTAIAVDTDGLVYVLDTGNYRVQRFTGLGTAAMTWGAEGAGEGQFKEPSAIAVGPSKWVYVLDKGNQRVQVFNSVGRFILSWGESVQGDGKLRKPSAIAVGPEWFYVVDQDTRKVQRFNGTGVFFDAWELAVSCVNLTSPRQDEILDNGRSDLRDDVAWDFDWSDCEGATRYHLYVIGANATIPVIDDANIDIASYSYVSPGSFISDAPCCNWSWKVRALVDGRWSEWSDIQSFEVEPVNTDLPSRPAPPRVPGATAIPDATPTPAQVPTATPILGAPPTPAPSPTPTSVPMASPTRITFEALPNGAPITSDLVLSGDEFADLGISLAGAPVSSYCASATRAAILAPLHSSALGNRNYLSTSDPDNANSCNTVPVTITFNEPVRNVTLLFVGASVIYTMNVYDTNGALIGSTERVATCCSNLIEINFALSSANISRVNFGSERAVTAIQEIRYSK